MSFFCALTNRKSRKLIKTIDEASHDAILVHGGRLTVRLPPEIFTFAGLYHFRDRVGVPQSDRKDLVNFGPNDFAVIVLRAFLLPITRRVSVEVVVIFGGEVFRGEGLDDRPI